LTLEVAFQYRLIEEELADLYAMNIGNYEDIFMRIARDSILEIAGTYEATTYWLQRTEMGEKMKENLDMQLREAHAECIYFQLLTIALPEVYEDAIVKTQVETQTYQMKQYEQNATIIRKQISVLTSETNQAIIGINATATAKAYNLTMSANSIARNNSIITEKEAYKNVELVR